MLVGLFVFCCGIGCSGKFWWCLPASRTSITASLLGGVVLERRRDERTSRLMRGRFAMDIEDILNWGRVYVLYCRGV